MFTPISLYMENSSFRDILKRMLEEAATETVVEPAPSKAERVVTTPLLQWELPQMTMLKKNGYATSPRKTTPRPPKKTVPASPEVLLKFETLEPSDQSDVQLLIVLGADFREGVSLPRLKKAHRHLAKHLHPDHVDKALTKAQNELRQEKFLVLQAAYERLSRSLPKYKSSESICGNESASAADFRRPDAA